MFVSLLQFRPNLWHLTTRVGDSPDETHNAKLVA
jgi:hypothetical protein